MIQSGGFLIDLLAAIPQAMFLPGKEILKKIKKRYNIEEKCSTRIS